MDETNNQTQSVDVQAQVAKLRETHLHNEQAMDELHKKLEAEYADLSHKDMFSRVKSHILDRTIAVMEYRRRKMAVNQEWIENEVLAIGFNKDSVGKDLQDLVTRVELRLRQMEGGYDIDNQVKHCRSMIRSVYVPSRLSQITSGAGAMVTGTMKAGASVVTAPLKMAAKPFKKGK